MSNANLPIRLAIVVTVSSTANSFVLSFAEYVASLGNEVTVICDGIERSSRSVGTGAVHQVPVAMVRNPHPLKDFRSLVSLYGYLRKENFDLIAYGTPKAALLCSIASLAAGVPKRVYQLRGLRLETTTGLKRKIFALLEKLTSACSTNILANSMSLARVYRELKLNSRREIDVLGLGSSNGVQLDYFSRDSNYPEIERQIAEQLRSGSSDLVVGFVGRLHPDKGIDTLIEAIRILRKGSAKVKLMLVGSDEGAEIDEKDFGGSIVKVGPVKDVRPYYAEMDVLILPSLREGFPNVVLEAASMSVPAVVSNGTGVIDSVEDGTTGIVVPGRDPVSLAAAIQVLAQDRKLIDELGEAARTRVEREFDQEIVWARTFEYLMKGLKQQDSTL